MKIIFFDKNIFIFSFICTVIYFILVRKKHSRVEHKFISILFIIISIIWSWNNSSIWIMILRLYVYMCIKYNKFEINELFVRKPINRVLSSNYQK